MKAGKRGAGKRVKAGERSRKFPKGARAPWASALPRALAGRSRGGGRK